MKFTSSFKHVLFLNFVLAAIIPVTIFAFITVSYVKDYLLEDVSRDNLFLASEIRADTVDFLQQPVSSLKQISRIFNQDVIISADEINTYLEREVRSSNFFESIFLLDRDGKMVHLGVSEILEPQKPDYFDLDLSAHEVFANEYKNKQVFWTNTFISIVTGEPSITLGLRVGELVLVGNASLEKLSKIVSRFTDLKDLQFAIVDRKGIPIAHSDHDKALQRVSMMDHPEIVQALNDGLEEVFHLHEEKGLLETVLTIPDLGWAVWVGRDRDEVLAPIVNVQEFMLFILLGSILIGAVQAFLQSRKLMQPISELVEGTRKLADGVYHIDMPEKSYREIDNLAAGFKQMIQAVTEREASIGERERRFRNLVDSIEGIVWEYDVRQEGFVFVSRHCEDLLGCSYTRWLESADYWKTYVHPDDRQWVSDYFQGMSEGNLSPQFEFRMIDSNDTLLWVRNMVHVVFQDGKPSHLYGVIIDITERKKSEIALRHSEARFRSLVEQAADAIFIHDQYGRFVEVNDQACQMLGYKRDELLNMMVQDIDALHDPLHFHSVWSSVRHGETLTLESQHRRRDGKLLPVEVRLGAFALEDLPLYIALSRDISDRKKAEAALRESEERYRSVVNAMTEGVLLYDGAGNLVASNPSAEEILRRNRNDLLAGRIDDDWNAVRENGRRFPPAQYPFALSMKNARSYESVLMGLKFDATESVQVWIEFNTRPIMLEEGKPPSGVVATFTDVTEKRQVLKALQDSEEQVRLLLNSTAEGIYGVDLDGRCTFCNPSALELLGFADEKDVLGQNMHELVHHSQLDGHRIERTDCQILSAFEASDHIHSDDEVFWRSDGSWFHVEYFAHPIHKDGEALGAVVTFHDVTERKLLQQQSIRTAQLASLGELAAGVAHEINNPINGVINYAQILLNRLQEDGFEAGLAERIMKEGERIAVIVRDLLFFAREGGPEMKISEINEVLSEALSLTEAQIRKEGILLKFDIEDNLPLVSTRAQQIQQLFLNVMSNARHALNEKYPGRNDRKVIEISMRCISKNGREYIRISFKDYGIGIPEPMLAKVMNPFVTSKPAGIGTGLGLSISHEIVESHNGEINLDSREGEWTEVTIELPTADKEDK